MGSLHPAVRRHGPRALGVAIVVALFAVVLPRIADYGAVWELVSRLTGRDLAVLAAVAVLNVLTFGPPWMAALPGLSFRHSLTVSLASTAISNVAPGGDAVGLATTFAMLRGWGFERARTTLALVVFTVWNQLVNVAFPVIAIALLAGVGQRHALLQLAASVGAGILAVTLAAFAVALRSEAGARRVGALAQRLADRSLRLLRRPPRPGVTEALVQFRSDSLDLLRRRWAALTLTTLAGHLTVWVVLIASLRAVGVDSGEVSLVESFAAWALVRLLTAVPITPGGLGIVELGLTGVLVGFGGGQEPVVAAVLLYRALTFLPPLPLGLLAGLTFRRRHPEARVADGAPARS
jgi:putative heme transporter